MDARTIGPRNRANGYLEECERAIGLEEEGTQ